MKYNHLRDSIESAAGLRLRLKLQPLGGEGDTIFPSTVAGGKYLIAPRRVPGYSDSVSCAIIDSVASQANRMEDALLEDILAENIFLPHVVTDFAGIELLKSVGKEGKITCFDAPHRIFDAIIRDSMHAGKHFPFTSEGAAAIKSSARDATAIFGLSPASLLFGSWDSTGVSGGLGEKYARCVVSELVGINVEQGIRAGLRRDPLEVAAEAYGIVAKGVKDEVWEILKKKNPNLKNSSHINHSSVPWGKNSTVQTSGHFSLKETAGEESVSLVLNASAARESKKESSDSKAKPVHGGITCDYIRQTTTVSLAAIRQLHFPVSGKAANETSAAAQAVLAAIAIHAATLNTARGWHLRACCDLIPGEGEIPAWEIIGQGTGKNETLDASASRELLKEAISAAKSAGLPWRDEPFALTPSPALAKLVVSSQKAHRDSTEAEASN